MIFIYRAALRVLLPRVARGHASEAIDTVRQLSNDARRGGLARTPVSPTRVRVHVRSQPRHRHLTAAVSSARSRL